MNNPVLSVKCVELQGFFDLYARRGEQSTSYSDHLIVWKQPVLQTIRVRYLSRPRPDLKVVTYLCKIPVTNLLRSKVSNGLTEV